jgi:hypothetical protein
MKNAWKILILLIAICGLINCASATSNYNNDYNHELKIASFDGNISNMNLKFIDYGSPIKNIEKTDVFINNTKLKTFTSLKNGWFIPRIYSSTLNKKFRVNSHVNGSNYAVNNYMVNSRVNGSNYAVNTFDVNGKQLDTFKGKIILMNK